MSIARVDTVMLRIFRHYVPAAVFLLIIQDVAIILAAVNISAFIAPWLGQDPIWAKTAFLAILVVFALHLADLYDPRVQTSRRDLAARLLLALVPTALCAAALAFAVPILRFGRLAFFMIFGLVITGLFASRTAWAA